MTSSVNAVEDARPNARDRQALEDRVGQDERRADHRRRGGQEDRLETGRSRLDQRRTQDDALGETAVEARATSWWMGSTAAMTALRSATSVA